MSNINQCIYLIAPFSILNRDTVPKFEKLSENDSIYLQSLLYSNYIMLLEEIEIKSDIMYCLDINDKDFIQKNYFPENSKIIFLNYNSDIEAFSKIYNNYSTRYNNNLLIISNSIALKKTDINKIFNLLNKEDNSVVIGKSQNDRIVFLAFNHLNPEVSKLLLSGKKDYSDFLVQISKMDIFVNNLSGFLEISDLNDFKELYKLLAKKESLEYCSQDMHERFTHLFVEYKELLNE